MTATSPKLLRSIPIVYYGQEQGFSGAADPVSFLRLRMLTHS